MRLLPAPHATDARRAAERSLGELRGSLGWSWQRTHRRRGRCINDSELGFRQHSGWRTDQAKVGCNFAGNDAALIETVNDFGEIHESAVTPVPVLRLM
jgi:hypothetical protein